MNKQEPRSTRSSPTQIILVVYTNMWVEILAFCSITYSRKKTVPPQKS